MKRLFLSILFLLGLSLTAAYAATPEELMYDSLAKAYLAGEQTNRKESENNFKNAFKYARRIGSWSGMLDAGMGLLVLGKYEDAAEFFSKAADISKRKRDWRGEIALAYIHLAMPKDFIDRDKAFLHFDNAGVYALQKEDWRGLLESARGFLGLASENKLLANLDAAYKIAKETKSLEGLDKIAAYYKEAGQIEKGLRVIDSFNEYRDEYEKAVQQEGETYENLLELSKKDKEKKDYYTKYSRYYGFPYYYQYYSNYTYTTYLPSSWLSHWCSYYLDSYEYRDGFYFYSGK